MSVTITRARCSARNRTTPIPVLANPTTKTLFPSNSTGFPVMEDYLSFNVLIATSPRMIAMIQNLTITFGSTHPFSSKW